MKISKGLFLHILLSNCLSEPAAKFLAFANLSSSSNVSFGANIYVTTTKSLADFFQLISSSFPFARFFSNLCVSFL